MKAIRDVILTASLTILGSSTIFLYSAETEEDEIAITLNGAEKIVEDIITSEEIDMLKITEVILEVIENVLATASTRNTYTDLQKALGYCLYKIKRKHNLDEQLSIMVICSIISALIGDTYDKSSSCMHRSPPTKCTHPLLHHE